MRELVVDWSGFGVMYVPVVFVKLPPIRKSPTIPVGLASMDSCFRLLAKDRITNSQ
jgi:hypothetical protein